MEIKRYSLEIRENNTIIRVFRIIFGITCVGVAIFWLVYNLNALKTENKLWITLIFLTAFGLYLIWSGLGYGYRFIDIGNDHICFRKNSFLKKGGIQGSRN